MAGETAIGWTDVTWNPLRGCTRVSTGCERCYAEQLALKLNRMASAQGRPEPYAGLVKQVGGAPRWTGKLALVEDDLAKPLHWRKPRRVFVNSMSDLFHEQVEDAWLDRIFAVMAHARARGHVFQVLTKRPARMLAYLTHADLYDRWMEELNRVRRDWCGLGITPLSNPQRFPLENVHLGVSVENQQAADERIPLLVQTPAVVRWVSAEPLLGPIDFQHPEDRGTSCNVGGWLLDLDWVVVGGESGHARREMQLDWLAGVVNACRERTDMGRPWPCPVFVKQDSGPRPGMQGRIPDALWAYKQFPRAS
jgi:protein gp37